MIQTHDYPVTIRWTGDTQGRAGSIDQLPELTVGTPPEFGGEPRQWSPEHLFVASVASCFMTTLLAIAGISRLEIRSLEVPAVGTLERGEDRLYSIPRIELHPRLVLTREEDHAKAERLMNKAEQVCLISRSITSEVALHPVILVEAGEPASVA